ncbi:DUF6879 family protein [Streptomyces sp. NPDC054834]
MQPLVVPKWCAISCTQKFSWWRPWLDVVAEATGRGVVMRRLRVVSLHSLTARLTPSVVPPWRMGGASVPLRLRAPSLTMALCWR